MELKDINEVREFMKSNELKVSIAKMYSLETSYSILFGVKGSAYEFGLCTQKRVVREFKSVNPAVKVVQELGITKAELLL